MSFNLLYVAIVIFSLLIVGLVLTVMDFKENERASKIAADKKRVANNLPGMTADRSI